MKTELRYRTVEEVLDSVGIDLTTHSLEGNIQAQKLLKVITKINYQLGLRINQSKTQLLEVTRGKVKLPADFSVANYALLCDGKQTYHDVVDRSKGYADGLLEGALLAQSLSKPTGVGQHTVTMTIHPGYNRVEHQLGTIDLLVQASTPDGDFTAFKTFFPTPTEVGIFSEAEITIPNVKLILVGAAGTVKPQTPTCELVDTGHGLKVIYNGLQDREEYHTVQPLRFVRSKGLSAECQNMARNYTYPSVTIQNGFLIVGREGSVLLSYQSVLEDEEGNLLTLDHPKVNDYYEYALKEKIFEDLWLDGGEDVAQKLSYIQERKLRPARTEALSFINTPDFAHFQKIWEMNRQAQLKKYYSMFMS